MIKLITGFSHMTDNDLSALAQHVIVCMTENENFPTPQPSIADLSSAADAYAAALAAQGTGGKEATIVKNQKRTQLQTVMSNLARYAENNSNDDPAIAASAGFPSAKEHTPVGPMAMPKNLTGVADKPGEITLHITPVEHASAYIWQYKSDADTDWKEGHSKKSFTAITDLQGGVHYTFRVAAIGSNPSLTWSNPISLYAQ